MSIFKYTALTDDGQQLRGELEADSEGTVRRQLIGQGLFVVNVSSTEGMFTPKNISLDLFKNIQIKDILEMDIGPAKVPFKELVSFTRQFATLIDAGIPIIQSLDALIEQTENRSLARVLKKMRQDMNEGLQLANALENHKSVFNELYINMVSAAEASGSLGKVLGELADLLEERQALASQLRSSFTYPIFMLVVGLGVVAFLLTSVVPNITSMFADTGSQLPQATVVMLAISDGMQSYGIEFLIALTAFIFALKYAIQKNDKVHLIWDMFLLRLPIFGMLARKSAYARFTGTLSALLASGVPILTALQNATKVTPYLPFKQCLSNVAIKVGEGAQLGDCLKETQMFPSMMVNMIVIGEKSGRLEDMLEKVGDTYSNDLKVSLSGLTSLVQPLLLLFMGGLIAFIMMAVLLPVFELNTIAGGV